MGFKLTWVSVRDSDRTALLCALRLRPSGHSSADFQEGIGGRAYGTDRYVVVAIDDRGGFLDTVLLDRLSRPIPLLVCHVHEGCMYSHAAEWAVGIELWRVTYDGDRSEPFEVAGNPPSGLKEICAEKTALQDAGPSRRRTAPPARSPNQPPPDLMAFLQAWNADVTLSTKTPPAISMRADHMFDVPIALCAALTGLRHDHASFWDRPPFERLVPEP